MLPQLGTLLKPCMSTWGRPTDLVHNFQILQTRTTFKCWRPVLPYFKSRKDISQTSLRCGVPRTRFAIIFFPAILSTWENKKILPKNYLQGQIFNISSTKHHIPPSRNQSFQYHHYYKVYIQWVSWSLSPWDLSPKNVSARNYTSHCLSPTCLQRMRSKKRLKNWETSKSRL